MNILEVSTTDIVDATIPSKVKSNTRKSHPWITSEIKLLIRKRNRYFKTAKQSNHPEHWRRYKKRKECSEIQN